MKPRYLMWMVVVLILFGLQSSTCAAYHSTSKPTPPILLTEGTVVSVNLQSAQPSITLTLINQKTLNLNMDQRTTTVWKKDQALALSDLRQGQHVRIRYKSKNGQQTAKSIDIV